MSDMLALLRNMPRRIVCSVIEYDSRFKWRTGRIMCQIPRNHPRYGPIDARHRFLINSWDYETVSEMPAYSTHTFVSEIKNGVRLRFEIGLTYLMVRKISYTIETIAGALSKTRQAGIFHPLHNTHNGKGTIARYKKLAYKPPEQYHYVLHTGKRDTGAGQMLASHALVATDDALGLTIQFSSHKQHIFSVKDDLWFRYNLYRDPHCDPHTAGYQKSQEFSRALTTDQKVQCFERAYVKHIFNCGREHARNYFNSTFWCQKIGGQL